MEKKNLNVGHRKRLREKFLISPESLKDYELLEMLLFISNPRKDTKLLSKELLEHFGNLNNVLNATNEEFSNIENFSVANIASIKCVKEIINRFLKNQIKKEKIRLNNIDKVELYCRSTIGSSKNEHIKALFLNTRFELVKDEILNNGNNQEVKLYKNILITKATQYGCSNIILTHNHPSGDPSPSANDIDLTIEIQELLKMVDMQLLDHIIVSNEKTFSMGKNGLLDKEKAKKYKSNLWKKRIED